MNPNECDRSGCYLTPVVRVRFRTAIGKVGGHWWYYCQQHAWPLDEEAMMWGAKGPRARPLPVEIVEHL